MNTDLYGMKIRSEVLLQALHFENMINKTLVILLDIDERKNVSFGRSGRALSFEAKVTLLMDLKVIDPNEKLVMSYFMSVRNKFMHQLDASTYEMCVDQIQDLEKFIKKHYDWNNIFTRESNFERGVWNLGNDCTKITTKLYYKILDKINTQSKRWSNENKLKAFELTMDEFKKKSEVDPFKKNLLNEFQEMLDTKNLEIRNQSI